MKKALVGVLSGVILAAGTVSSLAAVIDFGVNVTEGTPPLSYDGATLDVSTAFDLGGASLFVRTVGADDNSGLAVNDLVSIEPMDLQYATSPFPSFTKSWTDPLGTFTEVLTSVKSINRGTPDAITVEFTGTLNGPGFVDTSTLLIFTANQAAGPGGTITASFTETANSAGVIPEPSTWAMMLIGLAGLGFAGYRRSRKSAALAV
jgi:hypothetical protein